MEKEELIEAIATLNETRSLELAKTLLDQGCSTQEILRLLKMYTLYVQEVRINNTPKEMAA